MTRAVLAAVAIALAAPAAFAQQEQPAEKPKTAPMIGLGGGMTKPKAKPPADPGDGKGAATLTMALRKFDFAGTKSAGQMYMPSSVKLSPERPDGVRKEPAYDAAPKYAVIQVGSAAPNAFVLAFDEPEGKEPRVYLDLNANGDLTDDKTGSWEEVTPGKEGAAPECRGTWAFKVNWAGAEGAAPTSGEYALNFYRSPDRETVNYYRASARVGKIRIGTAEYEVTLIENDNDGRFDKLADPGRPVVVGEPVHKPVWLALDGDRFDIRGTFPFAGMNYLAQVSDDGTSLRLEPTMRVVPLPRVVERPKMIGTGVEAPDFQALAWKAGQQELDKGATFKLSDYRGKKIVVLDLWATWCGPCMAGIPHLSRLAEATKDQDVVVIALNSYDDEGAYVRFASGKGQQYQFMIARDPAGRERDAAIAGRLYGVTGIPATFVIDKSGKIVEAVSGYTPGDTRLEAALKGLGVKFE